MNPVMKDRFYGKGNEAQIAWVVRNAGLTAREETMFRLWHSGETDEEIEAQMSIDKDTRRRMEELITPKVSAAVLYAISYTMASEKA